MVTVAIAGGVGSIGLNIVNAIYAASSHRVIVLSRSDQPDLTARDITVRIVDYTSPRPLEHNLTGIDTLICRLPGYRTHRILDYTPPRTLEPTLTDIDSVICCLPVDVAHAIAAQLALVSAAKRA